MEQHWYWGPLEVHRLVFSPRTGTLFVFRTLQPHVKSGPTTAVEPHLGNSEAANGQAVFFEVNIRLWALFILFAAYPALTFVRGPLRRRRRRKRGLCLKCGYNLTGNVSGICPECGTEVPAP